MKTLFSLFLIVHGIIHAAIWLPPATAKSPFDPKHSWLLGSIGLPNQFIRIFAITVALAAALALIVGGVGLLAHLGWGKAFTLAGAAISLVLFAVYFNPWLSLAVLLNLGVIYLVAMRHWPVA